MADDAVRSPSTELDLEPMPITELSPEDLVIDDTPELPASVAARMPRGVQVAGLQSPQEFNIMSGRMALKGMPTKTASEALAHMREIAMMQVAQQRRMTEQASRTTRHREETDAAERAWLADILPKFAMVRQNDRVQKLFFQGVPPSVRPLVWKAAIDNARKITIVQYEQCIAAVHQRSRQVSIATDGTDDSTLHASDIDAGRVDLPALAPNTRLAMGARKFATARKQIDADVPRTHILAASPHSSASAASSPVADSSPDNLIVMVNSDGTTSPSTQHHHHENGETDAHHGEFAEAVRTLLCAFVELQPETAYVQGMSYLAAMLLFELPPFDAFVGFSNLISSGHFPFFYSMNHRAMSAFFNVYEQGLTHADKELATALRVAGASPELYAVEWWMTLFSRSLPVDVARRCWDMYLGNRAMLYRITIATVLSFKDAILDNPSECLVLLTTLNRHPAKLHGNEILDMAASSKALPSLPWLQQIETANLQPWHYNTSL
jgi:hypothetical protein